MRGLLISACLLGVGCRYDGRRVEKIDSEILEKLTKVYNIVPFCPEVSGGLPTPRTPSERQGERVVMADGRDVSAEFLRGAEEAYALCLKLGCDTALLKERSPSCGVGRIYDGSFSGRLTDGDGVTAEYLKARGIRVLGESEIEALLIN